MMDIVIGHASTDEVFLAMLDRKSLKQSLHNLHPYGHTFICLVHFVYGLGSDRFGSGYNGIGT
jgi:hypothetical protein